eukprot:411213_1
MTYCYTLNSKDNVQALGDSFKSPQQQPIDDGMEPTPPANSNSNSPYSILRRHSDTMKLSKAYDLWRISTRNFYKFKKGGISLLSGGLIDNTEWARNWRNLYRLPHTGLMCLNVYQVLGGSYRDWISLHQNFYGTSQTVIAEMMKGEAYYRKECHAIFDKIGHINYKYKRIPSNEKKSKSRARIKRPLSPQNNGPIELPSSLRNAPSIKRWKSSQIQPMIPLNQALNNSLEEAAVIQKSRILFQ